MDAANINSEMLTEAAHATNRSAFARFVSARGLSLHDEAAKAGARRLFDAETPLLAPGLATLCLAALASSLGPPPGTTTVTVWQHLRRTFGGEGYTMSFRRFAEWHASWAAMVFPKGEGVIYGPVSSVDGMRLTDRIGRVYMLILDCDGTGDWHTLVRVLMDLGIASIAHQSGGYAPGMAKWRVIIPLAAPFDTSTPAGVMAWRTAYATARTVFGALAGLSGAGFDPATDLVCNAWYPGYRRQVSAPPRFVMHQDGATLDLVKLAAILPAPTATPPGLHQRTWVAMSPSLLELLFDEAGLLGHELADGKSAVVCPWNDCHSTPLGPHADPTSATVLFPPSSHHNIGNFFCAHASCGPKGLEELLEVLPADAVQRARLRHRRGEPPTANWNQTLAIPRLGVMLPRLPLDLP